MGTDQNPAPDVEGAVWAARDGLAVILVGDERRIRAELARHQTAGLPVEVVHAPEQIAMDDKPSAVLKGKAQSSMHLGMALVQDGTAQAFVTMGNTGAAYAVAMLAVLRRIPGVKRPALSGIFRFNGRPVVFLDVGANADARADWLAQFAHMGEIYARQALGLPRPRVMLLSNGEEEGKGTDLLREADALLRQSALNYGGNIEPKDVLKGSVDVVVTDGFTGNILTKTFEASTRYLAERIRAELKSDPLAMLGGVLIRPAMGRVRRSIDTFEVGGAPLLGVQGVVIIGHGRSNAFAVRNAVHQARRAVDGRIVEAIRAVMEKQAAPNAPHDAPGLDGDDVPG